MSETSSDTRIDYMNSKGEKLIEDKTFGTGKPATTDTDYHFNMIANPSKVVHQDKLSSSESELNNMMKSTESDSDESSKSNTSKKSNQSRAKFERISLSPKPSIPPTIPAWAPSATGAGAFVAPSGTSAIAGTTGTADVKPLSQQEIRMKKIELIRKLCEIKSKGFSLTKEYDFNSSIEEMEYEYELLKSFADKRNGVKMFRNGILQAVSVIEFLNDKYDPFDFHLTGWGDHLQVEVDSWEDVLEELYEKYKGSGKKMAPEIKLLYLIIASAGAFHFTKSQASKVPGLDAVLANNPGLLSKIMNPKKGESSQFMTPQEINLEKQKEELRKKDIDAREAREARTMMQKQMQMQQMQMAQMQAQLQKQQELINNKSTNDSKETVNNILNSRIFTSEPMPSNSKPMPQTIPASKLKTNVPDIRAPDQVKDILSRIHNMQKSNNTDTQDESSSTNNDRLVSESTFSESNPKKKGAKKKGLQIF